MNEQEDLIWIFTSHETEAPVPAKRRGGLDNVIKKAAVATSEVAVSTLQNNVCRFLQSLDTILSASPKSVGELTVDEVEIHAQIDGKGNIGLAGLAQAEFSTQGGIKFVLRRKL